MLFPKKVSKRFSKDWREHCASGRLALPFLGAQQLADLATSFGDAGQSSRASSFCTTIFGNDPRVASQKASAALDSESLESAVVDRELRVVRRDKRFGLRKTARCDSSSLHVLIAGCLFDSTPKSFDLEGLLPSSGVPAFDAATLRGATAESNFTF